MTRRRSLVLLGTLALMTASAQPPTAADPADTRPVDVSIIQLIATPAAFDGKAVRVKGFVRVEHEGTSVYLHRDDCEYMLTRNGLWLAASDVASAGSREAAANNRYALIEGRFNARVKGHKGLWSGAIEQITRMEPLARRKGVE